MPTTDILISEKLYTDLEKYAQKISKSLGRTVTVDDVANASLQVGFDNPLLLEETITNFKVTKGIATPLRPSKPNATYAKRGEEFITLTPLFVVKKK